MRVCHITLEKQGSFAETQGSFAETQGSFAIPPTPLFSFAATHSLTQHYGNLLMRLRHNYTGAEVMYQRVLQVCKQGSSAEIQSSFAEI